MKKAITMILCIAMVFGVSACGAAPVPSSPQTMVPTAQESGLSSELAQSGSLTYISDYSVLLASLEMQGAYNSPYKNYAGDERAPEMAAAEDSSASPSSDHGAGSDYSGTNIQVEGVDEGDIVKTDGEYIYVISGYELVIFRADGPDTEEIARITVGFDERTDGENDWSYRGKSPSELYVYGDRLAVISSYYSYHDYENDAGIWQYEDENYLTVDTYDLTDPTAPVLLGSLGQDGGETASRMIDGKVYVVSSYYVYNYDDEDPGTFVPKVYAEDVSTLIDSRYVYMMPYVSSTSYAVICVYDLERAEMLSSQTVLGAGNTIYMNDSSLYLASGIQEQQESQPYTESVYTVTAYSWRSATEICRFSVSGGTVEPGSVAKVEGYLRNQFSLDEYDGRLRVVTTRSGYDYKIYEDETYGFSNYVAGDDYSSSTSLYILDTETMDTVGSVNGLAEGETVYSVRFDGDWAYFCTFETVDPLFAVDVSDPTAPIVVSELEITGFSDYLHVWTDGLLFGLGQETVVKGEGDNTWITSDGMKLVMFDISDKAAVTAKSVLAIDADWSEALYNHKAILIDYEKNIIGFPAGDAYDIYGWTADRGFFLRARIETGEWSWGMRGLYIGDCVYVVSDSKLTVLDLGEFMLSATLNF